VPVINDVSSWAETWTAWWISLQPASRRGEALLRDVTADEAWAETKKGSINGFYNVVVTLSWWMQAIKTEQDMSIFTVMVRDVDWVLKQMLSSVPSSSKHGRDDSDLDSIDDNPAKRYVQSIRTMEFKADSFFNQIETLSHNVDHNRIDSRT
jgi:hypothetical protein